jgi:hypothetical protein
VKRAFASILCGVAIAGAIAACGAAPKSAVAPAPARTDGGASPSPGGMHDNRIVEADSRIAAAMKQLGLEHAHDAVATCARPPCGPDGAMTLSVKPSADPKCTHGTSQTCTDTCTLADSICENADTICKIAKELGSDPWANGKCAGAETSCEKARAKCCGCS